MPINGKVVTEAKKVSRDGYRWEYKLEGSDEWIHIKGDHPHKATIVADGVSVAEFVRPKRPASELKGDIRNEFWRRAAVAAGVDVEDLRLDLLMGPAPAGVQALWAKAKALMNGADISIDDVKDDANW